ncbi:hypothetical protein Tco_0297392, partial [Tanacetum coccineum]
NWTPQFEVLDRVVWIDIEGTPFMRICVKTKFQHLIAESFKVVLKGKVYVVRAKEVTGWVPDFRIDDTTQSDDISENNSVGIQNWVDTDKVEVIPGSFQN